ncbi:hypothetical protein pb186bvf_002232 [Paramecium bursaria]
MMKSFGGTLILIVKAILTLQHNLFELLIIQEQSLQLLFQSQYINYARYMLIKKKSIQMKQY